MLVPTNFHLHSLLIASQPSGLRKIIQDIKFMLNIDLGILWKFAWGLCPVLMVAIFAYNLAFLELPRVREEPYPAIAYGKDI